VNATGTPSDFSNLSRLIDIDTLDELKTRKGWDGFDYQLLFSDEFNDEAL
jgi:hypothetical protein